MVPTVATVSSNLSESAVPCHEPNRNIPVQVQYANQKVLLLAQNSKQNKIKNDSFFIFLESTDPSTGMVTHAFPGLEP